MFTGIILELGEVVSFKRQAAGAVLAVKAGSIAADAAVGDSIAVNGACLTVTEIKNETLSFDLSDETLRSTTLGSLKAGDKVNLEPALRADGRLGGHFVTGHVDAVGRIRSKTRTGDMFKFEIEASSQVMDFLVEKGSVAVDGISLTVVDVLKDSFTVVIIPHTAEVTTIGFKGVGDTVNLEADIIGKYVLRFLNKQKKGDEGLMGALLKSGYLST
jgi:riboflavin synthase